MANIEGLVDENVLCLICKQELRNFNPHYAQAHPHCLSALLIPQLGKTDSNFAEEVLSTGVTPARPMFTHEYRIQIGPTPIGIVTDFSINANTSGNHDEIRVDLTFLPNSMSFIEGDDGITTIHFGNNYTHVPAGQR